MLRGTARPHRARSEPEARYETRSLCGTDDTAGVPGVGLTRVAGLERPHKRGGHTVFSYHPNGCGRDHAPTDCELPGCRLQPGPEYPGVYRRRRRPNRPSGLWGSAEYLLWWFKTGRVPPLVTAGGNGVLGSPGTQLLFDNLPFDRDVRQGGRFSLGYRFDTDPAIGIQADYFFVPARQRDAVFSSGGTPLLAQPFFNITTGRPDATLIAAPGIAAGSAMIGGRTSFWGAEANLTAECVAASRLHLKALGGFRFLRLGDELTSGEQFHVAPGVDGFGGNTVQLQDQFHTDNNFYGGQVGLEAGLGIDRLAVHFRGKLALGSMQQDADVNGSTLVVRPNGSGVTGCPLRGHSMIFFQDDLAIGV